MSPCCCCSGRGTDSITPDDQAGCTSTGPCGISISDRLCLPGPARLSRKYPRLSIDCVTSYELICLCHIRSPPSSWTRSCSETSPARCWATASGWCPQVGWLYSVLQANGLDIFVTCRETTPLRYGTSPAFTKPAASQPVPAGGAPLRPAGAVHCLPSQNAASQTHLQAAPRWHSTSRTSCASAPARPSCRRVCIARLLLCQPSCRWVRAKLGQP